MSTFPRALERRFKPVGLLGQGGYGAVWLAVQTALDRQVAVKVLHNHALDEPQLVQRFLAEARVTAALAHPNIVILVDHNVDDGLPWIAYEYLPGPSLAARIGKLSFAEAVTAGLHVARALEAAHARGVLHRDVKPDNVIADGQGGYKVTDFGIARWVSGTVKTAAGVVMGTPPYMAPEMFLGEPPSPAVDLYALGVLLFEALTGRVPFGGDSVTEIAEAHLRGPVPPLPGVPPRLERLVRQALAKRPAERPESAGAMAAALEEILAARLSPGQTARPRVAAPRRRVWPWLVLAGALGLGGIALRRPAPPAAAMQVDVAIDRLIQELKDEEQPRVRFDQERTADKARALSERIARDQRRLAEIEAAYVPERYEPPRQAHVAFRLALCRWVLACWEHRARERTDAFGAPEPRKAWPELVARALALPAAIGDRLAGDRSWLAYAAANDIAFLARHFAHGIPCAQPPEGVEPQLAGFREPGALRRLFRQELRIGLEPALLRQAGEVAALCDTAAELARTAEPATQHDLRRRTFDALEAAYGLTIPLFPGRPAEIRQRKGAFTAAEVAGLRAERATAALVRQHNGALAPHPEEARGRMLQMRACGLTWTLDTMLDAAEPGRPSEAAAAERAYAAAIAAYVAREPHALDAVHAMLWECRLFAHLRSLLAAGGTPDPRTAALIAEVRAMPAPGARAAALRGLIAANLALGDHQTNAWPVSMFRAMFQDLRAVFAGVPGSADTREALMRDLNSGALPALDRQLLPEAAAETDDALALADGLVAELVRHPPPRPMLAGFLERTAALAFLCRVRVERRGQSGDIAAVTGSHADADYLPPPPWDRVANHVRAHVATVRLLLAGSKEYSHERDEALARAAFDLQRMSRELDGRSKLMSAIPRALEAELSGALASAPDADPAVVALVGRAFLAAWRPRDPYQEALRAAVAAASRWKGLCASTTEYFELRR